MRDVLVQLVDEYLVRFILTDKGHEFFNRLLTREITNHTTCPLHDTWLSQDFPGSRTDHTHLSRTFYALFSHN